MLNGGVFELYGTKLEPLFGANQKINNGIAH
jgi:hypothetical protein